MSEERQARILASLRELFEAIAAEARGNPSFAGKVEASLANARGKGRAYGPNCRQRRPLRTNFCTILHSILSNVISKQRW